MTADEINALPLRVRRYIHDLETICDPTGMVQTIWSQRDQIEGLVALLKELREWSGRQDLNLRPAASEAAALPD